MTEHEKTTSPHPFSQRLLAWYDEFGRELPWRSTRDPYRIWISEIILQQTRVAQGYDYYLRFIHRFPTVETLAAAPQDEVMRQWEGLGYYSRARNLHAAAQQIVEQGGFPTDYEGVKNLKGVGDYTAAAICSFAYDLPTAVVDGNVYRVLSRFLGIDTPIDSTAGKKTFAALAQELIVAQRAADYNQAIMDFGALQCTPRAPQCLLCPLNEDCAALAEGNVESLPIKAKKVAISHRYFVYIWLMEGHRTKQQGGSTHFPPSSDTATGKLSMKSPITETDCHTWIHRRGKGDIWQGLYEPLLLEFPAPPSAEEVLQHPALHPFLSEQSTLQPVVSGLTHQLTHRKLHADGYALWGDFSKAFDTHPEDKGDFIRIAWTERENYAFPKLVHLILERFSLTDSPKDSSQQQ